MSIFSKSYFAIFHHFLGISNLFHLLFYFTCYIKKYSVLQNINCNRDIVCFFYLISVEFKLFVLLFLICLNMFSSVLFVFFYVFYYICFCFVLLHYTSYFRKKVFLVHIYYLYSFLLRFILHCLMFSILCLLCINCKHKYKKI